MYYTARIPLWRRILLINGSALWHPTIIDAKIACEAPIPVINSIGDFQCVEYTNAQVSLKAIPNAGVVDLVLYISLLWVNYSTHENNDHLSYTSDFLAP